MIMIIIIKVIKMIKTLTISIIGNHVQEEVTDLLLEAMGKHPESKGFLIDGFPASIEQARI